MKKFKMFFALISLAILFSAYGCDDNEYYYDDTPPSAPTNLRTISGDNRVDIIWDYVRESDVAGYNVYFSYSFDGRYTLLGNTKDNYFIDWEAVNGVLYYYAVTAYDFDGNESELSRDVIYDVARPEGFNQSVFDYLRFPNTSGYNFAEYLVVPYNDLRTDLFFENYLGTFYLNVHEDTDIQDMGRTSDIYDIDFAPIEGWVPLLNGDNIKYVEARVGHSYVIWTWDNHFAKIRISQITNERVVFDWAYQLIEGERQLKTVKGSAERKGNFQSVIISSR